MTLADSRNCYLELEFVLKPGKRREFRRSFEGIEYVAAEGNIRTAIYEDLEEPGHMIWVTEWVSRAHAERYLIGDRFGVLLGGLRVIATLHCFRLVGEAIPAEEQASIPAARSPQVCCCTTFDPNLLAGERR